MLNATFFFINRIEPASAKASNFIKNHNRPINEIILEQNKFITLAWTYCVILICFKYLIKLSNHNNKMIIMMYGSLNNCLIIFKCNFMKCIAIYNDLPHCHLLIKVDSSCVIDK